MVDTAAPFGFKNLPTDEAQARRIELLKEKNLLWIAPSIIPGLSKGLAMEIQDLVDLGTRIIAIFGSEKDILFAKMSGDVKNGTGKLFSEALFADMSDESTAAEKIADAVYASGIEVHGVFSPYENAMTLVGLVAERMSLPTSPVSAYILSRNKHAGREALRLHNIPTPLSAVCPDRDCLPDIACRLKFPMIAKPTSGAGSEGVYKINNEDELYAVYDKLSHELSLETCTLNWNPGMPAKNCVLLEQYIVGDEYDVDMLLCNGEVVFSNLIFNWPGFSPYFMESASHCPCDITKDDSAKQQAIKDYAYACVKAMGFTMGCFHVEIIYTPGIGPLLVEVNPRMGGGYIYKYATLIYGVDLMAEFVLVSLGIPINPPQRHASDPAMYLAELHVTSPLTGTLVDDRFMDPLKDNTDVISYEQYKFPNDAVIGIDTGVPDWVCKFILCKDSTEKAIKALREIERQIYDNLNILNSDSNTVCPIDPTISFYNCQD